MGDIKQSSTNRAAPVLTLIHLPTWGHFLSVIKSPTDRCPRGHPGFAEADRSAAYKQLPLVPERGRLAMITFRDPQSGSCRAFLPNTQLFGGATAVRQYDYIRRIFAYLATRFLKIPVMEYFDDSGLATPLSAHQRSFRGVHGP